MLRGFIRIAYPFKIYLDETIEMVIDDLRDFDSFSKKVQLFKLDDYYLIYKRIYELSRSGELDLTDTFLYKVGDASRVKGIWEKSMLKLSVVPLFSPLGFVIIVFSGEFKASEDLIYRVIRDERIEIFKFEDNLLSLRGIAIEISKRILRSLGVKSESKLLNHYFQIGFSNIAINPTSMMARFLMGLCLKDSNWRDRTNWPSRMSKIGKHEGDLIILCKYGLSYFTPALKGKHKTSTRKRFRDRLFFIQTLTLLQYFLLSDFKNSPALYFFKEVTSAIMRRVSVIFQGLNPYVFLDESLDIFQSALLYKSYSEYVKIYQLDELFDEVINYVKHALSEYPFTLFMEIFEKFEGKKIPKINFMLGLLKNEIEKEDVLNSIFKEFRWLLNEYDLKVLKILSEKFLSDVEKLLKSERPINSLDSVGWLSTNQIYQQTNIKKNIIYGTGHKSPLNKLLSWNFIEVKKPKKAIGRAAFYRIKYDNKVINDYLKKAYFDSKKQKNESRR